MQKQFMQNFIQLSRCCLFCICLLFTGCGKKQNIDNTQQDNRKLEINISDSVKEAVEEGDLTQIQTEAGYYLVVPNIFVQDYEDVKINNNHTIGKRGTQIVSLCMLESFWNNKMITPDEFIDKHKDFISNNAIINIDDIASSLVNLDEVEYVKDTFNPENMVTYFDEYSDTTVLLEIPHNSKYGKGCAYLIITGISDDGYVAIRDPNKWNIEQYAMDFKTMNGEYLYPLADVLCSAGNNSTMYIFRWRQ